VTDQGMGPSRTGDVAEREALRDEFWRSVPKWVHRRKFLAPTPVLMREVEAGLRRLL
jgi:hypothetical protein